MKMIANAHEHIISFWDKDLVCIVIIDGVSQTMFRNTKVELWNFTCTRQTIEYSTSFPGTAKKILQFVNRLIQINMLFCSQDQDTDQFLPKTSIRQGYIMFKPFLTVLFRLQSAYNLSFVFTIFQFKLSRNVRPCTDISY